MESDVLLDGEFADSDWLSERALQFGDGLFETIAVIDGRVCLWSAHMRRLALGCRCLRLPEPDFALLADEAALLARDRDRAVLKLFWTAGRSTRGYRRTEPLQPRRFWWRRPWPDARRETGWRLMICRHRVSENPALARIKHLNRLDQVIARSEWSEAEIDEGVLCGQDGRVVSGTMSNLFLQCGAELATPVLDRAGIAGVVRELAMELSEQHAHCLREAEVSLDDLYNADAVYLSNSLIGVVRVGLIDTQLFDLSTPVHPLMAAVANLCHRPDSMETSHG